MGSDSREDTGGRPQYLRPESLGELLTLLRAHGADARLLAGGTDLLVGAKKGPAFAQGFGEAGGSPVVLIDLKRVAELRADVAEVDGRLRIGARAVMTDLIENSRTREFFPALVEAARVVGSVQIRNRATLAGNLCNASPAADTAPPLLAYGASLNLVSKGGSRQMPLHEFFAGPGRTVLAPGELVASIDLPLPTERTGGAFGRLTRRRGVDLAIVSLCCVVRKSGDMRFAFGAVGPRPFVVSTQHDAPLDDVIRHASVISDLRASADYRLAMLPVLARRALSTARRAHARGSGAHMTITLTINGGLRTIDVQTHHSLLETLRDELNLTGTKECCAEGECGSCTVLLNGRAVNSCLVLAVECDGESVTTIEGMAVDGQLDSVQQAFVETGAVQCGFCIPGMIVAARYLLSTTPSPSEDEIKEGLAGNLCRCGGYSRIIEAVALAARRAQLSSRAQLKLSPTATEERDE